jgi:hypothetical protein
MGDFFANLVKDQDGTTVHYLIPWIVFCALAIAIPAYYSMEGRKRFFGHHALNKWALDRLFNQLWPLGLVGLILIGAVYGNISLFSWPLWHLLWALWALGLFGYWAYYFAFKYREHLASYRHQRTKERYMPPQKKRARAAGAR